MSLKNKVVVVTGGVGFIGGHLIERILKDEPKELIAVSTFQSGGLENIPIGSVTLYYADLSNRADVGKFFTTWPWKPDVVFNLAVVNLLTSLDKPEWSVRQNIDITLNLLEAQRQKLFGTLVQFSSSEAYGTTLINPMREDHPVNPTTPYGASKLATDHIALSYQKTFGADVSVIRPFNAYGPRQDIRGLIPATINRALHGGPICINGDGTQSRDYVYVTDVVDAAIKIYENEETRGKILNIGYGRDFSVNTIVETIANYTKYTGEFTHNLARPGEVQRLVADIELAKSLINYSPKVDFEWGIKTTIDWYENKYGKDLK